MAKAAEICRKDLPEISYKYHLAVVIPGCKKQWSGQLENLMLEELEISNGDPCKDFVQEVVERFPYVFYSHRNGLQKSVLWMGTPDDELHAIQLADEARFLIAIHTGESQKLAVYAQSLTCLRNKLRGQERLVPVYIGTGVPSQVALLNSYMTISVNPAQEERDQDQEKVHNLVFRMETTILSEILNPENAILQRPDITLGEITKFERETAKRPLKKYLYFMIGNTHSKAAKQFQRNMEIKIRKKRKSMIVYEGFWDWDSEPGREIEVQFEEKIQQSHFVIAVYQDKQEKDSLTRLLSAFKYHIDNGSGNNEYIPVLLHDVKLPLIFNNLSSLDFYKEHAREMQWTKLTHTVCDNINMLKISPFEKFDYCLHHGLNLFLRIKANKLSQQSFVRADRFIIHMQELLNVIVNNLICEIAHCKKTTGRVTGKGAMGKTSKERMKMSLGLFTSLLKQAYLEFCDTNRRLSLGHKCLFLNKNYMVTKVISSQTRKLAYICLEMGLEKEVTSSLSDLAEFLRKKYKYLNELSQYLSLYLKESDEKMITDYEFSHLSEIEHFVPDMERIFSKSSKLLYQLQTIEHRIHLCSENKCTSCYDQAGLKHIYFYLESLVNNIDQLDNTIQDTKLIKLVVKDIKHNFLSIKEILLHTNSAYHVISHVSRILYLLQETPKLCITYHQNGVDVNTAFEKLPIQLIKTFFIEILQLYKYTIYSESNILKAQMEVSELCDRLSAIKQNIKQCKSELSTRKDLLELGEKIWNGNINFHCINYLTVICFSIPVPKRVRSSGNIQRILKKHEYLLRQQENKNQRRKFLAPKINPERHRVNKVMLIKRSYKR